MKTNLELYKTFYYVAKSGNITQASKELMISQPAVSKAIKVLERDLNTTLFNRKKDGVSLNNAGEILFNKIKKSIELIISSMICALLVPSLVFFLCSESILRSRSFISPG